MGACLVGSIHTGVKELLDGKTGFRPSGSLVLHRHEHANHMLGVLMQVNMSKQIR